MFMGIVHQGEKVLQIPAERWVIVTVDQAGQQRFVVGGVMTSVPSGIRTDSSVPTSMMTLPSISKAAFSNGTARVPSTIRFALMAVCIARFSRPLRPTTALGKPIGMVSSVRRDHRRRYREHHENA